MDIHNRADDEDNSDDAENDSLVVFPDIGQFLFKIHFRQLLFFELHLLLPCHVGFITTCVFLLLCCISPNILQISIA